MAWMFASSRPGRTQPPSRFHPQSHFSKVPESVTLKIIQYVAKTPPSLKVATFNRVGRVNRVPVLCLGETCKYFHNLCRPAMFSNSLFTTCGQYHPKFETFDIFDVGRPKRFFQGAGFDHREDQPVLLPPRFHKQIERLAIDFEDFKEIALFWHVMNMYSLADNGHYRVAGYLDTMVVPDSWPIKKKLFVQQVVNNLFFPNVKELLIVIDKNATVGWLMATDMRWQDIQVARDRTGNLLVPQDWEMFTFAQRMVDLFPALIKCEVVHRFSRRFGHNKDKAVRQKQASQSAALDHKLETLIAQKIAFSKQCDRNPYNATTQALRQTAEFNQTQHLGSSSDQLVGDLNSA